MGDSTGSMEPGIRKDIRFFSMARNLRDDGSFHVWMAKLYEFDPGLTIRYMRLYGDRFSETNRALFNNRLLVGGRSRWAI